MEGLWINDKLLLSPPLIQITEGSFDSCSPADKLNLNKKFKFSRDNYKIITADLQLDSNHE